MKANGVCLGLALWGIPAHAAHPLSPGNAGQSASHPPTLEELTHRDYELEVGTSVGRRAGAEADASASPFVWVERLKLECPLGQRRYFAGAEYATMFGEKRGGGAVKLLGGNLQLYTRSAWRTPSGLALGFGLGLVLPATDYRREGGEGAIAERAITFRPWQAASFLSDVVALRPWVDVRHATDVFTIQFRQGLHLLASSRGISNATLLAETALYAGLSASAEVTVGIEGRQLYVVEGSVPGVRRAAYTLMPHVRWVRHAVQPSFSLLSSVADPGDASEYVWGFELALALVLPSDTKGP